MPYLNEKTLILEDFIVQTMLLYLFVQLNSNYT